MRSSDLLYVEFPVSGFSAVATLPLVLLNLDLDRALVSIASDLFGSSTLSRSTPRILAHSRWEYPPRRFLSVFLLRHTAVLVPFDVLDCSVVCVELANRLAILWIGPWFDHFV
jgi:hypothetical protein